MHSGQGLRTHRQRSHRMRVRPFGVSYDATTFCAESGSSTVPTNVAETPEKNRTLGCADRHTRHPSSPLEPEINPSNPHALPRAATLPWFLQVRAIAMLDRPRIAAGPRLECNGDPGKEESGPECAPHHPPRCSAARATRRFPARPIDASSSHLPSKDRKESLALRFSRSRLPDALEPAAH